jgi:type IV secretion system protein VirB5
VRNYLPSGWQQVANAAQGGGGALAADIQSNVAANSVLSAQRVATLSPGSQQLIQAMRQWGAARQSIAHQALANSSDRFASLQTLISAIGTAGDQKGILDLQARISAELGMLQNEQTKLQVLNQAMLAQESTLNRQTREMAIESHGHFATRFQPIP